MHADQKLKVVLCWHMHQPQYRDLATNLYQLPWTYLHALKDYVDMAALLEQQPMARAVVNFAPVLLEQIEDYASQIHSCLEAGSPIRDPLLCLLANPVLPARREERFTLIAQCLRANETRMIDRYPHYRRLADMAALLGDEPDLFGYLDDQYLADIVVWYHLVWLGETVHRSDERVQALVKKAHGFSMHDRLQLLEIVGELMEGIIGRYRKLAELGQIELSMNPYAHPITPLLLDLSCAREAMPQAVMPGLLGYPGGEERARWHMDRGLQVFESHFGMRPQGCWPSEGAVSARSLTLCEEYGIKWVASGESVLRHSLGAEHRLHEIDDSLGLYQPYRLAGGRVACFFRDDGLSDAIGFNYATWHGDDAANDFVAHLENIARSGTRAKQRVVSVILDGENAWETYPFNGYYFLTALYKRLAEHPLLEMSTFSDCLDADVEIGELSQLVAGSWVYGTLSTWIGERDKNRGWEMLGDAKLAFDRAVADGTLRSERLAAATEQLAVCEGSDWFWWFGDYNPGETVSDFERLFRVHLSHLYALIGVEPPEYLAHVVSHGTGSPEQGGVMRRGSELS